MFKEIFINQIDEQNEIASKIADLNNNIRKAKTPKEEKELSLERAELLRKYNFNNPIVHRIDFMINPAIKNNIAWEYKPDAQARGRVPIVYDEKNWKKCQNMIGGIIGEPLKNIESVAFTNHGVNYSIYKEMGPNGSIREMDMVYFKPEKIDSLESKNFYCFIKVLGHWYWGVKLDNEFNNANIEEVANAFVKLVGENFNDASIATRYFGLAQKLK